MTQNVILREAVRDSISKYLEIVEGEQVSGIYEMTLDIVEDELLRCVMQHVKGNQTAATHMLSMSRATLRKKLEERGILYHGKIGARKQGLSLKS